MKIFEFKFKFHLDLLLRVQLTITALVQTMDWHRPGDKPLSEPMMFILLTHKCITRLQWVNDTDTLHKFEAQYRISKITIGYYLVQDKLSKLYSNL